jgi:hypothetical protein
MATVADRSGNSPIGGRVEAHLPTRREIKTNLADGVTAPATAVGYAQIYVDSADGDLKVKFGDGTTKVIAADT